MKKTMLVKIYTIEKGLEIKENVRIIRIKSKNYNLLVMDDFVPIIGEIEGDIDIEMADDSLSLKNIKAYYMNSNNVFNLIVEDINV